MKILYLLPFAVALAMGKANCQVLQPALWSLKTSQHQVSVGDQLDLIFHVDIRDTWYLYSTDFSEDIGPKVTEFHFIENDTYVLIGDIKPIHPKRKMDEIFMGEVSYFEDSAEFRQTIRLRSATPDIRGSYEYQVCTTVSGKCISSEGEFTFNDLLDLAPTVIKHEPTPQPSLPNHAINPSKKVNQRRPSSRKDSTSEEIHGTVTPDSTLHKHEPEEYSPEKRDQMLSASADHSIEDSDNSLWTFALIAFLGGLTALITPCVFPMIPLTVSFFTNGSISRSLAMRKALMFGLFIIAIYTLAGTVIAWINGPDFANWLSTHWLPNLMFFTVFLIFSLSFLGFFEITLPSRFVNVIDKRSEQSGWGGIFFMAGSIVLVSFSCTGPIVGSLLVASAGGQILKPIVGMLSFSLAFALPFTLFAIFPQWLKELPRSGGWLNTVKVSLGFLELALGMKFLSVADQVYHWGILDRQVYLAIWIILFTLLGFYLLGKFALPHDTAKQKITAFRLFGAIASFSFVIYLLPGMIGAPLKFLAGYLPPANGEEFSLYAAATPSYSREKTGTQAMCEEPMYGDLMHFPYGLEGYFDLDQALACAERLDKPIFIDFTGYGCVNCREMEARVWSDPRVLDRLKNDYIMLALYVDEKTVLPENQWYTSSYDGKIKKSIGKQNADYQITAFNNNAQPFYALIDSKQRLITPPTSYDLTIENFVDFLNRGLENYQNSNFKNKEMSMIQNRQPGLDSDENLASPPLFTELSDRPGSRYKRGVSP